MTALDVERFMEHLPKLRKALALGGDTHDVDDVLDQISRGDAQLWLSDGALIVTEVYDTPMVRELRFWLACGDLQPVIELSHKVLDWGKNEKGCTQATLTGRKGWVKALAAEGWEASMVVMGRKL